MSSVAIHQEVVEGREKGKEKEIDVMLVVKRKKIDRNTKKMTCTANHDKKVKKEQ